MSTPEVGPQAAESYDVVIGRNIHRLMWDRQLTQTAFGPRIGIAQNTLTRKLRGQRGWSADEIAAAARELRVPVGVLFGLLPDLDSNQEPAGFQPGRRLGEREVVYLPFVGQLAKVMPQSAS